MAVIWSRCNASVKGGEDCSRRPWDRVFSHAHLGLQIKPISSGKSINDYQWDKMHKDNHDRFTSDFGGEVFFVYSFKSGDKKQICKIEVIEEIKEEIERLS